MYISSSKPFCTNVQLFSKIIKDIFFYLFGKYFAAISVASSYTYIQAYQYQYTYIYIYVYINYAIYSGIEDKSVFVIAERSVTEI